MSVRTESKYKSMDMNNLYQGRNCAVRQRTVAPAPAPSRCGGLQSLGSVVSVRRMATSIKISSRPNSASTSSSPEGKDTPTQQAVNPWGKLSSSCSSSSTESLTDVPANRYTPPAIRVPCYEAQYPQPANQQPSTSSSSSSLSSLDESCTNPSPDQVRSHNTSPSQNNTMQNGSPSADPRHNTQHVQVHNSDRYQGNQRDSQTRYQNNRHNNQSGQREYNQGQENNSDWRSRKFGNKPQPQQRSRIQSRNCSFDTEERNYAPCSTKVSFGDEDDKKTDNHYSRRTEQNHYNNRGNRSSIYRGRNDQPSYNNSNERTSYRGRNDQPSSNSSNERSSYRGRNDQPNSNERSSYRGRNEYSDRRDNSATERRHEETTHQATSRPNVVKSESLSSMNESREGSWANAIDECDFSQKLVFDDTA